tara:strand:+ start:3712 stop:4083 length:372 start_codon:yes stop_codon:yes gene_type:complete
MTSKIVRACVLVSKSAFDKYREPFMKMSINKNIIFTSDPFENKFTFSQIINNDDILAVENVAKEAVLVYKVAKEDNLKCADDIIIKNIQIEDLPVLPETIGLAKSHNLMPNSREIEEYIILNG